MEPKGTTGIKTTTLFLHSEMNANIETEDYTEMEELDY